LRLLLLTFGLFAFWVKGGFFEWEALEGKRTVEGKRLLKGKELLKGNCYRGIAKEGLTESLHREFYT
jgi:hypothetical protein